MPNRMLRIIVVFGLDNGKYNAPTLLSRIWNTKEVQVYPLSVDWRDGGKYAPKQQKLLALTDELLATNDPVALIGISAGASLAINTYVLRPQLEGIVTVCGALRLGRNDSPRFAESVASSGAFGESVLACETSQKLLTPNQIKRILIMKPLRDGLVPISTMLLTGAKVRLVIGLNHSTSIVTALLFYRRTMVRFLKQLA